MRWEDQGFARQQGRLNAVRHVLPESPRSGFPWRLVLAVELRFPVQHWGPSLQPHRYDEAGRTGQSHLQSICLHGHPRVIYAIHSYGYSPILPECVPIQKFFVLMLESLCGSIRWSLPECHRILPAELEDSNTRFLQHDR